MKKIIGLAIAVLAFAPTLLMCNENGHLWVNMVGFAYTIILIAVCKRTNIGKRIITILEQFTDEQSNGISA